jgi:hypothetical protein
MPFIIVANEVAFRQRNLNDFKIYLLRVTSALPGNPFA